jgi:predicted RNA-binding protein with PIN domain
MLYLIDGYNLLFFLFHESKKLEAQRNLLIDFLKKKNKNLKLKINLIFDAHNEPNKLSSQSYYKHLKVIYTPHNQTADEYILEKIFLSKNPTQITLVSSDKSLSIKAKNMKAKAMPVYDFLQFLDKKQNSLESKHTEKKDYQDTSANIERLLKIFEEKQKADDDTY